MTAATVRTVFLGSGPFGRPALEALMGAPAIDLVGVVTAPARPVGRRARLTATVIEAGARELGIPAVLTPERLRAAESVAAVLGLAPALLVLADYGQLVPAALLDVQHGALNLHPSLLPRHRGATPVPGAILGGDSETGVTLMRMDAGLDTGPIVAQTRLPLKGTERAPDLEARLAVMGSTLLVDHLGPWLAGEIEARIQDEAAATLTKPFRREDGRLDPTRPAVELERQVRARQPWPGAFVETTMGRLVVWSAVPERDAASPVAGTFDAIGLGVAAGERLRLGDVQLAGGKRMTWDAFVRGRAAIVGSSIVP